MVLETELQAAENIHTLVGQVLQVHITRHLDMSRIEFRILSKIGNDLTTWVVIRRAKIDTWKSPCQ